MRVSSSRMKIKTDTVLGLSEFEVLDGIGRAKRMAKISAIIPTHSRPTSLARSVEDARAGGSNVEVIVVDDASTDSTREVCHRLEGIKYIRLEANHHTAGARNVGVAASSGEYVHFHDDDDLVIAGSLDRL